MKAKSAAGRFIPGIVGLLACAAWFYAVKEPSQSRVYSAENLTTRWYTIFLFFAALFGLAFLALIIGFWKRLDWQSMVFAGINVATAWALVSFFFITSDSLAHPALTQIGLGKAVWLFLVGGAIWTVVAFLQLGRTIDSSKAATHTRDRTGSS